MTEEAMEPKAEETEAEAEPEEKSRRREIDPHAMLTVSASPHIKSPDTTRSLMIDVIIALLPSLAWGTYLFGFRSLTVTVVAVAAAILSELLYELILKKPVTIPDGSAAVTGLLIALNMPSTIPLWIPMVGSAFAILVVKQLFGGIGKNFMNPALAARAFLMLAWPNQMTQYPSLEGASSVSPFAFTVDTGEILAGATPMVQLKQGVLPDTGLFSFLIGEKVGCIGEVSALLLLVGGIYLVCRKVITWHIPVAFFATVALISYFFPATTAGRLEFVGYELLSGGLVLGAVFMATDYATSPVTAKGRLLFGFGCGAITMFIRYFGGYSEGVTFAILIMNTLVWYIDRLTRPVRFGGGAKREKQ